MSAPLRPPAKRPWDDTYAWNAPLVTAGCRQHWRQSESAVQKFNNTTIVVYPDGSGSGAPKVMDAPHQYVNSTSMLVPDVSASTGSLWGEYNYFGQAGDEKVNFASCRKRGWKALVGERKWHGCFGFDGMRQSPLANKKYLQAHIEISQIGDDGSGGFGIGWSSDYTVSVDKESGVATITGNDGELFDYIFSAAPYPAYVEAVSELQDTGIFCPSVYMDDLRSWVSGYVSRLNDLTKSLATLKSEIEAESFSTGSGSTLQTLTKTVTLIDTIFSVQVVETAGEDVANGPFDVTTKFTITLSVENTLLAVDNDIRLCLSYWDLTNDAEYPWRTDGFCGFNPVVGRDEVSGANSPLKLIRPYVLSDLPLDESTPFDDCSGKYVLDYSENGYYEHDGTLTQRPNSSGAIIGKPTPAGYERTFRFDFESYDATKSAENCYGAIVGYGEWSPDVLPKTATNWYRNFGDNGYNWSHNQEECPTAIYAYPQAWSEVYVDQVRLQIYAEVLERWPSVNYFRPAGLDRSKVDVNGDALWPLAWGILGRESFASVAANVITPDTTDVVLNDTTEKVLRVGDTVQFYNATMAAVFDTTILATNGTTTLTVDADVSLFSGVVWIMGAHESRGVDQIPHYALNDVGSKGQFMVRMGSTLTQHCLPPTPCSPSVCSIGFERSDKSWNSGMKLSIPAVEPPTTYDGVMRWNGTIFQRMIDPFYIDKVDCSAATPDGCATAGCDEDFCDMDIDAVRYPNDSTVIQNKLVDNAIVASRGWDKKPWVEAMNALPYWYDGATLITAPSFPTVAGGGVAGQNPHTPAVAFPAFNHPSKCYSGDSKYRYYTQLPTVGDINPSYYTVDEPWSYPLA